MLAAGDMAMSIVDYSKFIQLHLRGLKGENNYLTSQDYQKLHFHLEDYSYGWGNQVTNKSKISFHDGSAGTYYCHTILMPTKDLAVIIMTNSALSNQVKGIYELRELIIRNINP